MRQPRVYAFDMPETCYETTHQWELQNPEEFDLQKPCKCGEHVWADAWPEDKAV